MTEESAPILLEAFNRHADNADWYEALLARARTETDDLREAIAIADAAIEEMPEMPETTDEEEAGALEALAGEIGEDDAEV
jgi:hypothetical protein